MSSKLESLFSRGCLFSAGQGEFLGEAEDPSAVALCPHSRCLVVSIGLKVPRFLNLATVDVCENHYAFADPVGYFIPYVHIEITPAFHGRDIGCLVRTFEAG